MRTLVQIDQRVTVRMITEKLSINREKFGMKKVCAEILSKNYTNNQLQLGTQVCTDLLQ
jgi:hypothetical protein